MRCTMYSVLCTDTARDTTSTRMGRARQSVHVSDDKYIPVVKKSGLQLMAHPSQAE